MWAVSDRAEQQSAEPGRRVDRQHEVAEGDPPRRRQRPVVPDLELRQQHGEQGNGHHPSEGFARTGGFRCARRAGNPPVRRKPRMASDVLADERAQLLGGADDVGGRTARPRRRARPSAPAASTIFAHVFTETPYGGCRGSSSGTSPRSSSLPVPSSGSRASRSADVNSVDSAPSGAPARALAARRARACPARSRRAARRRSPRRRRRRRPSCPPTGAAPRPRPAPGSAPGGRRAATRRARTRRRARRSRAGRRTGRAAPPAGRTARRPRLSSSSGTTTSSPSQTWAMSASASASVSSARWSSDHADTS